MSKKQRYHGMFNDCMRRELNKYMGLPEAYTGSVSGLDKPMLSACKEFKVREIIELPRKGE